MNNTHKLGKSEIDFMMKAPIIFNEEQYGKYLYDNCKNTAFVPKIYTVKELTIYVKYLRTVLNLPIEDVKKELNKFCQLNWIGFEAEVEYKRIQLALKNGYETKLRTHNNVPISKNEWEAIQKVSQEKWQKWLFGILVIAKFNRLNPIIYEQEHIQTYEDTRLRCNISEGHLSQILGMKFSKEMENFQAYREYYSLGLMDLPYAKKLKRIIEFGEVEPKEEDILIEVDNFSQILLYFEKLKNNPLLRVCKTCGKYFLVEKEASKLERCKDCRPISKEEREKEYRRHPYKRDRDKDNKKRVLLCQQCGQMFSTSINVTTKKLCNICQVEKEYENKLKGNKIITCKKCGIVFEGGSKTKRELCDDCYKQYRAQVIKEANKKKKSEQ